MMTREEKLYSMTMGCLVEVANKLGIKIDKKGAKAKAVAKILEAEKKQADEMKVDESKLVPMPGAEKLADVDKEVKKIQDKRKAEKKQKAKKEITNPDDIPDDEYVAEVMEQKKELGIECPSIDADKVEIVKEKKQKSKKADSSEKPSKEVAIEIIKKSGFDFKVKGRSDDLLIIDPVAKIAVVYIGAKLFTVYFNGEAVKTIVETAGFKVVDSKEKFEYFSKVDINTLESVIKALSQA